MKNTVEILVKRVRSPNKENVGGSWKIAYADFVTAMMAFFLLMWLINMTSPEQKRGIAEYFSPPTTSDSKSGAGGLLGGSSVVSRSGVTEGGTPAPPNGGETPPANEEVNVPAGVPADTSPLASGAVQVAARTGGKEVAAHSGLPYDTGPGKGAPSIILTVPGSSSDIPPVNARTYPSTKSFSRIASQIQRALDSTPALLDLKKNVLIDETPKGLRIQIVDQDALSMFPAGSSTMSPQAAALLAELAKILKQVPNRISISGHTDSTFLPNSKRFDNWDLSSHRADAARRILVKDGLDPHRIAQIVGKADSDPLFPDNPTLAANRRIAITLLRGTA